MRQLATYTVCSMSEHHRLFIVLEQEFGDRLLELNRSGPVWIVDTPVNRAAAERVWSANPNCAHLDGVTTFKIDVSHSAEDNLINELDTIDLHHGIYSANPVSTILEVIGIQPSQRIKDELSQYGFSEFQLRETGFIATHAIPKPTCR